MLDQPGCGSLSSSILATLTKYHDWWLINYRNFLFMVLEAEESKSKVLAGLPSGEGLLPGS